MKRPSYTTIILAFAALNAGAAGPCLYPSYSGCAHDFSGDGKADVGVYDGRETWAFALSNGNGIDVHPDSIWTLTWNLAWDVQFIFAGDFNGDTKTDIGGFNGVDAWRFAMSTGDGFRQSGGSDWDTKWNAASDTQYVLTGDFSGDSLCDVGVFDGHETWRFAMSNGSGFDTAADSIWTLTWALDWERQFVFTGDFNGDGKTDIGGYNGVDAWRFAMSTGTEFTWQNGSSWDTKWNTSSTEQFVLTGDFNGDSLCDIGVYDGHENWKFAMSNGNGMTVTPDSIWTLTWDLGWATQYIFSGDFDGDGDVDIGGFNGDDAWRFAMSTDSGFVWSGDTPWDAKWAVGSSQLFTFPGNCATTCKPWLSIHPDRMPELQGLSPKKMRSTAHVQTYDAMGRKIPFFGGNVLPCGLLVSRSGVGMVMSRGQHCGSAFTKE